MRVKKLNTLRRVWRQKADIAETTAKSAAMRLTETEQSIAESQRMLNEYERRLSSGAHNAREYQRLRAFVSVLQNMLSQQNKALAALTVQAERTRREWMEALARLKALDRALLRLQDEIRTEALRKARRSGVSTIVKQI